jgi:hypothetical protein
VEKEIKLTKVDLEHQPNTSNMLTDESRQELLESLEINHGYEQVIQNFLIYQSAVDNVAMPLDRAHCLVLGT